MDHASLLSACREASPSAIEQAIEEKLPMTGYPVTESVLWHLAQGMTPDGDDYDNRLMTEKHVCLFLVSDHIDVAEHDYAAVQYLHQKVNIFADPFMDCFSDDNRQKILNIMPNDDMFSYLAKSGLADRYHQAVESHLSGSETLSKKAVIEAVYGILNCNNDESLALSMLVPLVEHDLIDFSDPEVNVYHCIYNTFHYGYENVINLLVDEGAFRGKEVEGFGYLNLKTAVENMTDESMRSVELVLGQVDTAVLDKLQAIEALPPHSMGLIDIVRLRRDAAEITTKKRVRL